MRPVVTESVREFERMDAYRRKLHDVFLGKRTSVFCFTPMIEPDTGIIFTKLQQKNGAATD